MHRHNTGMIEIGDRAGFCQIRFGVFWFGDQLGMGHLDGDQPIQLLVVRQIDESEAAFAQDLFNAVTTDLCKRLSRRSIIRRDGVSLLVLCHIVGVGIVHACGRHL